MLDSIPTPPSPCQGICRLEDSTCAGCGRLINEIVEWPSASAERKTTIRVDASKRLAILSARSAIQDGFQ
ncbi:MAG: DUF1289 domain-containing protein [Pseudomonadota bacterium]